MITLRRVTRLIGPLMILAGLVALLVAWHQSQGSHSSRIGQAAGQLVETTTGNPIVPPASPQPFRDDLISAVAGSNLATPSGGSPPVRLDIASVAIHEPIVEVSSHTTVVAGQEVREWNVADFAVGHHNTSADPGQGGNVVLAGHDDWHGEVFRNLHQVKKGDEIDVTTAGGRTYRYTVTDILLPRIAGLPLAQQIAIGKLIEPTSDARLTLVTCWPYGVDDHRLIVIAHPKK